MSGPAMEEHIKALSLAKSATEHATQAIAVADEAVKNAQESIIEAFAHKFEEHTADRPHAKWRKLAVPAGFEHMAVQTSKARPSSSRGSSSGIRGTRAHAAGQAAPADAAGQAAPDAAGRTSEVKEL
jgi:hypothetical protein